MNREFVRRMGYRPQKYKKAYQNKLNSSTIQEDLYKMGQITKECTNISSP